MISNGYKLVSGQYANLLYDLLLSGVIFTGRLLAMEIKLDRQKYLRILQEKGAPLAISELHKEIDRLEFELFEGRDGFEEKNFTDLQEFRDFSRELWNRHLGGSRE